MAKNFVTIIMRKKVEQLSNCFCANKLRESNGAQSLDKMESSFPHKTKDQIEEKDSDKLLGYIKL